MTWHNTWMIAGLVSNSLIVWRWHYGMVRRPLPIDRFAYVWMGGVFAGRLFFDIYWGQWICVLGDAALLAFCVDQYWKRKPPRKRKTSKVAGKVRNLGHRLVVQVNA